MTKLLTVKEVAEILNVKPGTVQDYCERKILPYLKIGGRLRFDKAEIEKYLNGCRVKPKERWPVMYRRRA